MSVRALFPLLRTWCSDKTSCTNIYCPADMLQRLLDVPSTSRYMITTKGVGIRSLVLLSIDPAVSVVVSRVCGNGLLAGVVFCACVP